MTLVGDEAEKDAAHVLAKMGFELVYQSRASRGSFDLLALRGPEQLGIQVKRSPLPLRFDKPTWSRMQADAKRYGSQWIVAAVADHNVVFCDPGRAKRSKEVRLTETSIIDNLPAWLQALRT
jgi:Holliday junction resolvase